MDTNIETDMDATTWTSDRHVDTDIDTGITIDVGTDKDTNTNIDTNINIDVDFDTYIRKLGRYVSNY